MFIAKIGSDGKPELDAQGKPVMVDDGKGSGSKGPVDQEAIDREHKLRKEAEEREAAEKSEKEKLQAQLDKAEKEKVAMVAKLPPVVVPGEGEKTYGRQADGTIIFPANEEEWDDLAIEKPTLHADLRALYNQRGVSVAQKFKESAISVTEIFPEMYVKDKDGNILRNRDGFPVPDENSERYQQFMEVAYASGSDGFGRPIILHTVDGPEMVALKLQKKLGLDVKSSLSKKAQEDATNAETIRLQRVRDGQIAPLGSSAPPSKPVEVKFNSEYEKKHAESAVASGVYKSLQEYCEIRDRNTVQIPYNRGI